MTERLDPKTGILIRCLDENDRMKQLLREILPDMEARMKGFRECYPGKEVLAVLTRTEDFVRRINEFTKEF